MLQADPDVWPPWRAGESKGRCTHLKATFRPLLSGFGLTAAICLWPCWLRLADMYAGDARIFAEWVLGSLVWLVVGTLGRWRTVAAERAWRRCSAVALAPLLFWAGAVAWTAEASVLLYLVPVLGCCAGFLWIRRVSWLRRPGSTRSRMAGVLSGWVLLVGSASWWPTGPWFVTRFLS